LHIAAWPLDIRGWPLHVAARPVDAAVCECALLHGLPARVAAVDLLPDLLSIAGISQRVVAIDGRRARLGLRTIDARGSILDLRAIDPGGAVLHL